MEVSEVITEDNKAKTINSVIVGNSANMFGGALGPDSTGIVMVTSNFCTKSTLYYDS